MAGVVVPTMKEKKDPLDTIAKGLSIAATVYGIKTQMGQNERAEANEIRAQEEHEAKIAKSNLIPQQDSKLVEISTVDEKGNPVGKFVSPKAGETYLKPKPEKAASGSGSALANAVKPDYKAKLAGLNASEKARFDHVRTYAKAVDEMEAALVAGGDRYSPIGDNDFTAALDRAAESYGRMQSGGAINKEEEARFKNMIRAYGDDMQRTMTKLKTARNEADSRFETLGFTSNEVPEVVASRKSLEELIAKKSKPQGSWGDTAIAAPTQAKEVVQNGWKYFLDANGKEVKPPQKVGK